MAYGGRQGSGGGDASAWDRHKRAAGGAANSTPQPRASPARDTHLVADGSRGLRCSQLGHRCLLAAGMGVRNAPCAPAPGPPRAAGRAPPCSPRLLPHPWATKGPAPGETASQGTLVKGFLLSFSMAARQVSSRALSRASAMSANLNCNDQAPAHQSAPALPPPSRGGQPGAGGAMGAGNAPRVPPSSPPGSRPGSWSCHLLPGCPGAW